MEKSEELPLVAWARLLGTTAPETLPRRTELILGTLAGDDPGLPGLTSRLEEIPTLSAAELSAVCATDTRPAVRVALLSAPRLPRPDRESLVEWAVSIDQPHLLSRPLSKLPFRRAVELYGMLRRRYDRGSSPASHLVDHLYRRPALALGRFEELLLLSDRLGDSHLAMEALRWALRSAETSDLEVLTSRLSAPRALDVYCALLGRASYRVTAPRARRMVGLLEECGGEHERLTSLALDDFFDLRPGMTPTAVEVLVNSGQTLLLRLVANAAVELPPTLLANLVVSYSAENLFELVHRISHLPQLWESFYARLEGLDASARHNAKEYLFQDATRYLTSEPDAVPTPELVNALSALSSDLLATDRRSFWCDSTTVTYLLDLDLAPASWWDSAAPTPEEVSHLLHSALDLYLHEREFPSTLPAPFEERMWGVPQLLPLLGQGLLEHPRRPAGRETFQEFLLRQLQLFLIERLGEDAAAWEVALSLASEFEGGAEALVETATALS